MAEKIMDILGDRVLELGPKPGPGRPYHDFRLTRDSDGVAWLLLRRHQAEAGLPEFLAFNWSAAVVSAKTPQATVDYLRERELVTSVYLERQVRTTLADGRNVKALTYVIDRAHPQYAGAVTIEEAARVVESAVGRSGPNPVYVANTVAHMRELGIRDHWLESVAAAITVDPS